MCENMTWACMKWKNIATIAITAAAAAAACLLANENTSHEN